MNKSKTNETESISMFVRGYVIIGWLSTPKCFNVHINVFPEGQRYS